MQKPDLTQLGKLLARRSKADLAALIQELAGDDPVLGVYLEQRLREEAGEYVWRQRNHAGSHSLRITIPDYTSIYRGFEALLNCGACEKLLNFMPQLLELGASQIDRGDDAAAVAEELDACAKVVFSALERIDWRLVEKLIWYWDCLLQDRLSLLEALAAPIDESLLPQQDWREAAEFFQIRLGEVLQSSSSARQYSLAASQRAALIEDLVEALERVGESDAVTDVLMAELPHSQCYLALVHHLADHGIDSEAETWARQGYEATVNTDPETAQALERYLLSLARRSGNKPLVAAFRVKEFLLQPSLESYKTVRAATKAAGSWELVQAHLLNWLEFGDPPQQAAGWPLPATGLLLDVSHHPILQQERNLQLLLDITLYEKEIDYATLCFERMTWRRDNALRIAEAAMATHPEISRRLLEQVVDSCINEVRVKSYLQAKDYLRQLQTLCFRCHWQAEFASFISRLRERHEAKQRLLEILDDIEATPPAPLKLVGGRDATG